MKKNSLYYKLIFSYMPLMIIPILLLVVIFFVFFSDYTKKQTIKANEILALQMMGSIDIALQQIDQYILGEIYHNEVLHAFFNNTEMNDAFVVYRVSQLLNNMVNSNEIIDSIYVYHYASDKVLTPNVMMKAELFNDQTFIREVSSRSSEHYNWSNIRPFQESMHRSEFLNVASLVRNYPLLSGYLGFLVINISAETLQNMVDRMQYTSYFQLLDGKNVSFSGGSPPLGIADSIDYLNHVQSNYTDWTITSGLTDYNIRTIFQMISWVWMILVICIILMGIAAVIFVSQSHYKPVLDITQRILNKRKPSWETEYTNEFELISSSYDQMIDLNDHYYAQHEKNAVFKRSYHFKEMLQGTYTVSNQEWSETMMEFDMRPDYRHMIVVILEIDSFPEFQKRFSVRDQTLFKFVLHKLIKEIAENAAYSHWTEWISDDQLGILYKFKDLVIRDHTKKIIEISEKSRTWTEEHIDFTITLSVGSFVNQLSDIPKSYEAAMQGLIRKPVLGKNRIIQERDLNRLTSQTINLVELLEMSSVVAKNFRLGDPLWRTELTAMFRRIETHSLTHEEIVRVFDILNHSLYMAIQTLNKDLQQIWQSNYMDLLNERIPHFETVDEIRKVYFTTLEHALVQFNQQKDNHVKKINFEEVKAFIDDNLHNVNMSLEHLGSHFHFSAKYIGKLFKEEYGINFSDYLVNKRIDRAKQLMMETGSTIGEIAGQVGYTYAISFIRAFKKLTGTTPGMFRNRGD